MSLPAVIASAPPSPIIPAGWRQWLPHKPDPDYVVHRKLYLSEFAYGQCQPDGPSKDQEFSGSIHQNLLAALMGFVGGDEINEGREMTWLREHSRNIWEIRAFSNPASRLIGWFADFDVFFGVRAYPRVVLRGGRSQEWANALQKCEEKRTQLNLPVYGMPLFVQHMSNSKGIS